MNRTKSISLMLLVITVLSLGGAGCANVKPWERGKLADYTMRPDRDPLGDTFSEHIYFTR